MRKQCDRCNGDKFMKDEDGEFILDENGEKIPCTLCLGRGYITISFM